ncbi:MAG: hypothetical protein NT049_19020, partial [Planctomycetota bacterium]|nr:hypothetical protein [Planctomycetota bacterium]
TQAYPMAKSVLRGMAMQGGRRILIQDEVEAAAPVEVLWGMVTMAKVTPDNRNVVLEQEGKRLYGQILGPEGAVFEKVSCSSSPIEHQQPNASKLVVRLPDKVTSLRLAVVFSPDPPGTAAPAAVKPLAAWPGW